MKVIIFNPETGQQFTAENAQELIDVINGNADLLDNKADLVNGVIPLSQLQTIYFQGFDGDGTQGNPLRPSTGGGSGLITPSTPTNGVVDNTANTFNWTNVSGYTALSDYEYSINGSAYTTVTAKPILVGNIDASTGQVKVRVKAVSGVSYASGALTNTTAFTTSGGGVDLGSPVTAVTYNNGGEIVNTNDFHLVTGNTDASIAIGLKLNDGVSGWMSQKYTGFAESGEGSTAIMAFGIGLDPFYGGINDSLIRVNGVASGTLLGYYNLGTQFSDANKIVVGSIIRGRFDSTTGYIEYSNDNGSTYTVLHSFPRPAGVIRVKLSMVGDQRFARDVRHSGFVAA